MTCGCTVTVNRWLNALRTVQSSFVSLSVYAYNSTTFVLFEVTVTNCGFTPPFVVAVSTKFVVAGTDQSDSCSFHRYQFYRCTVVRHGK